MEVPSATILQWSTERGNHPNGGDAPAPLCGSRRSPARKNLARERHLSRARALEAAAAHATESDLRQDRPREPIGSAPSKSTDVRQDPRLEVLTGPRLARRSFR
jgi:hypothetical protein